MDKNNAQNLNTQETMVKGSAWMTFGSIVSRILGALYIIPWYAWMGTNGNIANALTAKSYNIYSMFIIISTAGIPGAVAKQVAKYNALNEYGIGRKLFRRGLILMSFFGIISAAVMFFAAPILGGNDPRQIPIIRSLSYAVLIIPILSILRGYFQGYADMKPSALSQLVEQFARVAWMLLTAYIIMQVQNGSYLRAVIQSNLAAAVGAIFGIALLVGFLYKRRHMLNELVASSNNEIEVSTGQIFLEIINQSIPFVIIDAGITFFQLIDQYTFHPIMKMYVHASSNQIESWYALFGLNANKLIMIIVSLAAALAITAIPLLSGAHAKRDYNSISRQVENILELFLLVMIPASLGMAAISTPIYTVFYGYDPLGSSVLYLSAFTAITLGSFTVLMAIQQGLSENMLAIKYLILGIVIKFLVQLPMIKYFNIYGPLLATNLGLFLTIWLSMKHLRVKYHYNSDRMKRRFLGITLFSVIMFLVVTIIVKLGGLVLSPTRRISALILVLLAVGIGVLVYAALILKTGLAQKIVGKKINIIEKKLHLKK